MSDRSDLERDIAEEDQLASLLRPSDQRGVIPPFAEVARRAEEHRQMSPVFALVAAAALVVVVVAGVGGWRAASTGPGPTGSQAPAPTRNGSASGQPCFTPPPSNAFVGPRPSGRWLLTSLDAIRPTDQRTNQLHWILRFMVPEGAPAPATVSVSARVSAGDQSPLHVLGYETLEPEQRTVSETELLNVTPCVSAVLVVRTAGPLIDGIFPYTVTVEKVGLPEGGTVSETFALLLNCSNRTFTCDHVGVSTTPSPTATPVAGVLKPEFGIVYDGVRSGWEKGSAPLIRREGEAHFAVGELAPSFFNKPGVAVAPDGRRAAYFAQRQNEPWTLFLLDGARPNEQRVLATIPKEIPAGTLVWSGDGTGVVFVVLDEGANQGVRPAYSALRTLDVSSGAVTEVARVEGGRHYEVVGWDRANGRLAAMIAPHGEAPTSYLVLSAGGNREWTLEGGYSAVAAPSGRDVAAIRCQAVIGCSFWTWKLEDFDTRVDQKFGPGLSMGVIGWRPGTSDVGIFVTDMSPASASGHIELWSASAGRRVVFGPRERVSADAFFRADGSALVVTLAPGEVFVVDLASGTTSPLPVPAREPAGEIGRLRASIRLGS